MADSSGGVVSRPAFDWSIDSSGPAVPLVVRGGDATSSKSGMLLGVGSETGHDWSGSSAMEGIGSPRLTDGSGAAWKALNSCGFGDGG